MACSRNILLLAALVGHLSLSKWNLQKKQWSFSLPDDKTNMKQDPSPRNDQICVTGRQRVCTYDLSGIPWILFRVLPRPILSGDHHHFRHYWFISPSLFLSPSLSSLLSCIMDIYFPGRACQVPSPSWSSKTPSKSHPIQPRMLFQSFLIEPIFQVVCEAGRNNVPLCQVIFFSGMDGIILTL